MKLTTITIAHRFEMAHRLMNHSGKCRFLHGHSYLAEVEISAERPTKNGMVLDFADLKESVTKFIDLFWDHAVMLNEEDPLVEAIAEAMKGEENPRIVTIAGDPTAEKMALLLFEIAEERIIFFEGTERGLKVERVLIQETEKCCAEIHCF